MTHVIVEEEIRDQLMKLKKEKGLASANEVIKRLIKKCGDKISWEIKYQVFTI